MLICRSPYVKWKTDGPPRRVSCPAVLMDAFFWKMRRFFVSRVKYRTEAA
jgi:hypothetical protein